MRRVLGVLAALAALSAAPAHAETRYSLQGGCYSASGLPGAEKVRMQATDLGSYLLYRPDRTFVALVDGAPGVAAEPGPSADWAVTESTGDSFTLAPKSDAVKRFTVRFTPAEGCAVFPEASLDATGTPRANPASYGAVKGILEGHMHWMTYLYFGGQFHCGSPFHRYGIAAALPDCSGVEGPQGLNAPFQNVLNYGNPAQPHDTRGYPSLAAWSPDNLTYEGTYWRWIERAWMAGLRVMVMGVNENRVLCELQTNRTRSCNEMDTLRDGIKQMYAMQDYIDAQAGGPGKGFMRIVRDPFQARRVINQGKMAVILEIELSEPFDCANVNEPTCDQAVVDREFDEVYRLGVRSSLLVGKYDNPLVGVRFDSGTSGVLTNIGNRVSAGTFFTAKTCQGKLHDNEILTPNAQLSAALNSLVSSAGIDAGTIPAYPPAPHCNVRGLTPLGAHVVERMMDSHMIVNPDHMSQAGVDATLKLLEARHYSGVISPHGWMDPGNWPRLWKLGGMAFPGHSSAASYIKDWEDYRPRSTPFKFGWGYGADLGGLSHQPKVGDAKGSISYPFKGLDGQVTFSKQKTGDRVFDYTKEGVSEYGLYADWFADLRRLGGQAIVRDMLAGAESYLEMWERASGVPKTSCLGPGRIRLGATWVQLLRRAGQPQRRGAAWTWCAKGARNAGKADVAVLDRRGRVVLSGSTARRAAGPFRVGARARFHGLRRQGRFVAAASRGRIRAVGTSRLRGRPLTRAMIRLLRAKATRTVPRYVPGKIETQRSGSLAGFTLAGSRDAELNRKLALYCALQLR